MLPEPYYQKGNITIYHGDCVEILPQLEPVYAVVTDPPYGIGESSSKAQRRGSKKVPPTNFGEFDWDKEPPPKAVFDMLRALSKHQVFFGGNYFDLPPTNCYLVWDKDNGTTDFADCELAWTNLKKAVRLIKYKWQGYCQGDMSNKELRLHPTQKPVAVMEWCLQQLPEKSGG